MAQNYTLQKTIQNILIVFNTKYPATQRFVTKVVLASRKQISEAWKYFAESSENNCRGLGNILPTYNNNIYNKIEDKMMLIISKNEFLQFFDVAVPSWHPPQKIRIGVSSAFDP